MSDIIIKKLSKSFGEKTVLSDFSEVIQNGKTTVIMGESGCGKTTLVNIIMRLEKADSGEISGTPAKISAVFQDDLLCEDFSAVSNVRAVVKKTLPKEKIFACLNGLGLSSADLSCPVRELSGGMKRRVAIARTMLAEGELVIMDEPFRGLDGENRRRAAEFVLRRLGGRTLIAVTHDSEDIDLLGAKKTVEM
jgi:NitT/TauT family transport system ATP-binding protein